MKSHWISHKGKQIFCYDLSNLRSDVAAIKTEIQAAETVAFKQPKSSLLHLGQEFRGKQQFFGEGIKELA